MRLLGIVLLCLCFSTLQAQYLKGKNKWEVSLNLSPDFGSRITLAGARIEVDPEDIPVFNRRNLDTVSVFGQDRVFLSGLGRTFSLQPTDASFRFGAQLKLHRNLGKNFQAVIGLHYDQARFTTLDADPAPASAEPHYLYPVSRIENINYGLVTYFEYHLRPEGRLHPYFGMGASILVCHQEQRSLGRIYTGRPGEIILDTDPFAFNATMLDFDFTAVAGVLYRVLPRWQLGLTVNSRFGAGNGIFGTQVRYFL